MTRRVERITAPDTDDNLVDVLDPPDPTRDGFVPLGGVRHTHDGTRWTTTPARALDVDDHGRLTLDEP